MLLFGFNTMRPMKSLDTLLQHPRGYLYSELLRADSFLLLLLHHLPHPRVQIQLQISRPDSKTFCNSIQAKDQWPHHATPPSKKKFRQHAPHQRPPATQTNQSGGQRVPQPAPRPFGSATTRTTTSHRRDLPVPGYRPPQSQRSGRTRAKKSRSTAPLSAARRQRSTSTCRNCNTTIRVRRGRCTTAVMGTPGER